MGIACALGAAALWAGGTVVGKVLLGATHPTNATFWRFLFGLIGLWGILLFNGTPVHFGFLTQPELRLPVIYISLIPGFFAMIAYYAGLRSTPASIATFLELLFPVASVVLNWLFLNEKLTGLQLGAGAVLLASVTLISARHKSMS
jgi:drug/metabolite transporter (DMT)-like permease